MMSAPRSLQRAIRATRQKPPAPRPSVPRLLLPAAGLWCHATHQGMTHWLSRRQRPTHHRPHSKHYSYIQQSTPDNASIVHDLYMYILFLGTDQTRHTQQNSPTSTKSRAFTCTLLENMSNMYFTILLFTTCTTQIAKHSPHTNRLHAGLHGPMNVDGA